MAQMYGVEREERGGFNFDNVRRNEMLRGTGLAFKNAMKTGTTISAPQVTPSSRVLSDTLSVAVPFGGAYLALTERSDTVPEYERSLTPKEPAWSSDAET